MKNLHLLDKEFTCFIPNNKIIEAIQSLASKLNSDYQDKQPLLVVMLNGAFMFSAELCKNLNFLFDITFVKYNSYQGTSNTGNIQKLIGLNEEINNREVLIIEDIVDSGNTMKSLLNDLQKLKARSIKIATMLFKPDAFIYDYKIDYYCFKIPTDFIIGFGLDYNGKGRNLKDIYVLKNKLC